MTRWRIAIGATLRPTIWRSPALILLRTLTGFLALLATVGAEVRA